MADFPQKYPKYVSAIRLARPSKVSGSCVENSIESWYIEAKPMQIQHFDKMADLDQNEYVSELVMGAQQVLKEAGSPDLAARVYALFRTKQKPADKMSLGMTEFVANLAGGRNINTRNFEVEDAMALTLKKNDIALPQSFFTMMKDFKPRHSAKES